MKMKYMCIVSILIISMISVGCVDKTSEKVSPSEISKKTNVSTIKDETANTSDNTSLYYVANVSTEGTSVTKVFKIGEENSMLGVNIKLVNITDYDNNTVLLLINGSEYKYDSDTTVEASGIEVIDVVALEDDSTAEITVDNVVQ